MSEELQKELELSLEKEKLKEIVDIINSETLNYLEKRQKITEYIVEYRKNIIDEYKDDEDKLIDYFDHERYVKEETFKTIDRKLKELNILKVSPYFGSIEFREEEFGVEKIYIGRFGLTLEDSFEPLIIDWRAPIASLFYNGSLGEAKYKAPMGEIDVNILRRRQYIIKKSLLEGMFDSDINIDDDILQMVLSKNSSEKLKDIIMTIQKEQDQIIREDKNKVVLVDGVAGSGKTTIALHRVAYLLYNNRKTLEDKVLILGPNNIFIDYISEVLPSLGEGGVKQNTFGEFASQVVNVNEFLTLKESMERILKGDEKLSKDIAYKSSSKFKEDLDKLVIDFNENYFKFKDIVFRDKIVQSKEELESMFYEYYANMPLFRRIKKIKRIIYSKLKDARDEEFREIQRKYKTTKENLTKEQLTLEINNLEFKRKLEIRELIRELIEYKKTLNYLNPIEVIDIYNKMNDNKELHEGDLSGILYLKVKLEGIKIKDEIKHIVIDEAQDYSIVQFIAIKELTGCKSFTIVGDSNQRLLPLEGNLGMLEIDKYMEDLDVKKFILEKSYRSTKEIMEYANSFLEKTNIIPLVRSGNNVKEINISEKELTEEIVANVEKMRSENLENIAIITENVDHAEKLDQLLQHKLTIKLIDKEYIKFIHGITIMPSYFAKGLEFDGVIIVNNKDSIMKNYSNKDKLNYVMATRALHDLSIINIK